MKKVKLGVSSCLIGNNVRYDGGHKLDKYIKDTIGKHFDFVPVCPEVEYGLPVPREAMHLVGDLETARIITIDSKTDHTEGMKRWIINKLEILACEGLCGFIFKSRSPSSGLRDINIYNEDGTSIYKGSGIFAAAFIKRFPYIPVIDEEGLKDTNLRRDFFKRLFGLKRHING